MTDQQKKQKAIAVAFHATVIQPYHKDISDLLAQIEKKYENWLLTEEGKRLTAEEPAPVPAENALDALTKIAQSMVYLSEHQLVIKRQLDRIEGSMKFEPKE